MKAIDTDSELLDMALELMALTQKTNNPFVKKLLENFSTGLSGMEAEAMQHPFLEPVPLQQPDFSFLGNGQAVGIFSRIFNRSTKEKNKKCEAREKYLILIVC